MLGLQGVILVLVVLVEAALLVGPADADDVLLNVLLVQLRRGLVHGVERRHRVLDVLDQRVAPALAEVLAHHYPHQLQALRVRRHRVRRHHPPALAQLVRQLELVVEVVVLRVERKGHQRKAFAALLGQDLEAEKLQRRRQVVGRAGQVHHDGTVAVLAQPDQLVVLANDLGGAAGEVERERSLVGTQVIDVEDQFLRQELRITPDDPANTRVHKTVFVARDVD